MISVCPEVLGGLPCPRPRQEIQKGTGANVWDQKTTVQNILGEDVTDYFIRGAQIVLEICRENKIRLAVLKAKSPSCGVHQVYAGSFSGILISGKGVTSELLARNGIIIAARFLS